ncbi:MAG: hypothetical protein IJO45_04960 [Oscillospiraceae bacterium]|nr:hypothetical protein [Oscillospiraceae bacterium]
MDINNLNFSVDPMALVVGVKAATVALKGLDNVLSSIAEGVKEAFAVKGYKDYLQTVHRFGKDLADELLVLQMAFGKMKVAIATALTPIAEVFVPMLNDAIFAVIHFAGVVWQFLSAFIAGVSGNRAVADSAQEAADAEEQLGSAASSAGRAARRSVMAFDQLNRLNAGSGGGSGSSAFVPNPEELVISPEVQAAVDKLLAVLQPLLSIDFTPLKNALAQVWEALVQLAQTVAPALQWLWFEVLTPFAAWVVEVLAPALTEGFGAGLNMVCAAIAPVLEGMQVLWEGIKPIIAYIGTLVMDALTAWKENFELLSQVFQQRGPQIVGIFQNVTQAVTLAWEAIQPVLKLLREEFQATFGFIGQMAAEGAGVVCDALSGITAFLVNVFSGNWETAWEQLKNTLKSTVNGVIGLLNSMLSRLASALNKVIGVANTLSFTVPAWVPGIGGNRFGVNMRYVSAPQIPYLAQGAVLPANKPFLAVVGDQRHGTNIEAPLETIQQAVAVVMEDMAAGNMAGHQATVSVLREILEAVLGISIGDETIAKAVSRHNHRMAMLRGY